MIGTSRLLSVKTVQTKFLIISIPILLLSIAVLFALFELNAQHQATLKLHDKLDRLLVTQSAAMMTPVWNVADDQVKLMLDALAIDPDIRGAFVTDDADSLLGQVGLVAVGEFNAARDIVRVQGDERKVIGRISITLTDKRLQAETKTRLLLAGVLAVLLVLSVVASQLVAHRQTIGVPLERLLKAIKTSAHGGRRDPVQWNGRDEMATVVSAFNEMQVRQEAYEADLRNARDTLEQRVEDRTAELTKNQEELVEKEKALSDQLKFTEALIDTIPNPLWVKDTEARYVMFNRAYIEASGIRREDRIGKTVMEMEHLPLEQRTRMKQESMELLRTGGTQHNEQIRRWADGKDHNIMYWETAFYLADGDLGGLVGVHVDISEQKRAEEALRESEELFTTILDHMPAPVYLRDLEGHYKLINREYGKVYGVTKDDVRGKTPHEVFPKQQADKFRALDRAVLEEHRVQKTEETYSLPDGKHFLAVTKFPIFDLSGEVVGVGGVDVDITESKRAEEALAREKEILNTTLESMDQGISMFDNELRLISFNEKFLKILDLPPDRFKTGCTMEGGLRFNAERGDYGPGNVEEQVRERLELARKFEPHHFERSRPDGTVLEIRGLPTPSGGMVTTYTDITKRKRAEEALEEAYEVIKHQKERMEGELNVAHEIQMSMLPLTFPPFPQRQEFAVFATLQPAREVGGDFYDFFFIDEGRFCFCVGDVSGKGVPAALFMAVTKTLVKSRAANDFSPASILTHVNDELGRENDSCMFVTLFMGILDVKTGALAYTNAGHNPPYFLPRDGTAVRLDRCHGPVIGAMEGMVYQEDKVTVSPGDLLFLYTDGVTEAMDVKQQLYSEERLAALLSSRDFGSVEEIVDVTVADVWRFQGEGEQADDVTVLAVQFFGEPEGEALQVLELSITNRVDEITRVNQSFNAFAKRHGIAAAVRRKMNVVFDELLSNIVSHAYRDEGEHTIDLRAELSADRLAITITDDGRPFNPFTSAAPDTAVSMEERQMGGLGIHLVRNMMDEVSYKRRTDKNVVILVKHLEAGSDA